MSIFPFQGWRVYVIWVNERSQASIAFSMKGKGVHTLLPIFAGSCFYQILLSHLYTKVVSALV